MKIKRESNEKSSSKYIYVYIRSSVGKVENKDMRGKQMLFPSFFHLFISIHFLFKLKLFTKREKRKNKMKYRATF